MKKARPARQGRAGAQKRAEGTRSEPATEAVKELTGVGVNRLTEVEVKELTRVADTEITGETVNKLTGETGHWADRAGKACIRHEYVKGLTGETVNQRTQYRNIDNRSKTKKS